ncbi:hypothetical protein IWX49DRAFT_308176 [Phyllosticta citricarpa]
MWRWGDFESTSRKKRGGGDAVSTASQHRRYTMHQSALWRGAMALTTNDGPSGAAHSVSSTPPRGSEAKGHRHRCFFSRLPFCFQAHFPRTDGRTADGRAALQGTVPVLYCMYSTTNSNLRRAALPCGVRLGDHSRHGPKSHTHVPCMHTSPLLNHGPMAMHIFLPFPILTPAPSSFACRLHLDNTYSPIVIATLSQKLKLSSFGTFLSF